MTNPFEDENGTYIVLINDAGQYSFSRNFIEIPVHCASVHEPDTRQACLDYINQNWTDMASEKSINRIRP